MAIKVEKAEKITEDKEFDWEGKSGKVVLFSIGS